MKQNPKKNEMYHGNIYTINNNSNERKMHDYQPMLSQTNNFGRIIYLSLTRKMSPIYR